MKLKSIIPGLSLLFAWALTGVGQITGPEQTVHFIDIVKLNKSNHLTI